MIELGRGVAALDEATRTWAAFAEKHRAAAPAAMAGAMAMWAAERGAAPLMQNTLANAAALAVDLAAELKKQGN